MKYKCLLISILSFLLSLGVSASPNTNALPDSTTTASSLSSFTGKNSRLIGRFDLNTKGQAKFTWPGSAIEFRFEGSQAEVAITSEGKTRFLLDVDGKKQDFWTDTGNKYYVLASKLNAGEHTLRLTRVNESTAGITSLTSDPQVDGKLLAPPQATRKKLLVIGDSITAGYGVEGSSEACHYTLDTSNQQLTYAALAANALNADLHAIAWSGIGAWRSYGEKTPQMPSILVRYTRTLADDPNSRWDEASYQPDAILINIGTNDYWEGSVTNAYRDAMVKLLEKVQHDYLNTPIYLIVSPMLTKDVHAAQKLVLISLAQKKVKVWDLGESDGSEGYGCDYHPNVKTHARLGKELEKNLRAELHW